MVICCLLKVVVALLRDMSVDEQSLAQNNLDTFHQTFVLCNNRKKKKSKEKSVVLHTQNEKDDDKSVHGCIIRNR